MFLVIDANILFSFFNPKSARRRLIGALPRRGLKLVSPYFAFEELAKGKARIKEYAGIDEPAFIILFSLLENRIESVPEPEYSEFLLKAKNLAPHIKDVPYFALALLLNCPIWSDEKSFKEQD